MIPPNTLTGKSAPIDAAVEQLCSLLLEVAGRDTNRIPSARRHVQALDAALPHMTNDQQVVARLRIDRLQTRWGPLLPGGQDELENDGIPPETRVLNWLSLRPKAERHLKVLHRAARAIGSGETSLTAVIEKAYSDMDSLFAFRCLDTFREWLIQLRIAKREAPGIYRPGRLCDWWIQEMDPTGPNTNAYAACLKQLRRSKNPRWLCL